MLELAVVGPDSSATVLAALAIFTVTALLTVAYFLV